MAGVFSWYLVAQGRVTDFQEFLLDRREGLGQTTPDRGARCSYSLGERSLQVTRKAHGQLEERIIDLPEKVIEGFFGGQEALIETRSTAETYNCTNGEYLSHTLAVDPEDPIARVLFSTSGRNVAIVLNGPAGESGVEVFKFKVDLGESRWNDKFGSPELGLVGPVVFARLVGESLLVALESDDQVALHTYNFRSSKKTDPWNTSQENRPFIFKGVWSGETEFLERGKRVRVGKLEYDFTCKLETCGWKKTE